MFILTCSTENVGVGKIEFPSHEPESCILPLYYTPSSPAVTDYNRQSPFLQKRVLEGRLELPQACAYSALNATCLPIPPLEPTDLLYQICDIILILFIKINFMGFLEGIFGGKKEELKEPKRVNDGGDFMAVPGPDNELSEDEVSEMLKRREAQEKGEDIRELNSQ